MQGEDLQPPRALEWYPNQLAWHLTFSRTQLRKSPALARIHELIKRENEAGSITRQEAVSMVPPLFLGVEPHHMVSRATWGFSQNVLGWAHGDRPGAAECQLVQPLVLGVQSHHLVRHSTGGAGMLTNSLWHAHHECSCCLCRIKSSAWLPCPGTSASPGLCHGWASLMPLLAAAQAVAAPADLAVAVPGTSA